MTIVVVAAHPDDVELLCAGTLARLSRAGHQIRLAHLTYGDKGGRGDPEELAATRDREARAAAALINATTCGRICGDLELYPRPEFAEAVADLIAGEDVEAVFTHHPDDYHPDHRITSQLVLDAAGRRSLLPRVWFMDSVGGAHFVPTHLVDVTETIETKKRMLRCHQSQVAWMTTARHTDMEYMIEWTGRWRGLQTSGLQTSGLQAGASGPQAGADYAEGFAPAVPSASWFTSDVAAIPTGA